MGALLNQTQAAEYLGKSRHKVRRYTSLGLLPTFVDPESGRVMYPEPALALWLAAQEAKAS